MSSQYSSALDSQGRSLLGYFLLSTFYVLNFSVEGLAATDCRRYVYCEIL